MNKPFFGLLAAGAMLASIPALAQQKAPTPPAAAAKPAVVIPKGVFVKGQIPGQYLSKDRLIGASVQNKDGQVIGSIEDLIINGINNQVQAVIVGTGGFLGVGEKKIGVQLTALQFALKDGKTVIVLPLATKEVLTALEPFQRAEPKKGVIDRTKEKAKELTDRTKETAKDAAAAVKEKTAPVIEKAKEAVKPSTPAAPATPK